jgi:hypothetical protein
MTNMADNTTCRGGEGMTDNQMHSYVNDGGHDLKRAYDDMVAENQRFRAAEEKRKKRKRKNNNKGEDFKKLEIIKEENRLNDGQECAIGKMTRMKVWPDMKYYIAHYRKDLLEMSYVSIGMKIPEDREKYADHIIYYVDKKLTTHTHNCVGYIKRKVWDGGENAGTLIMT